jgi:hypothetical protein
MKYIITYYDEDNHLCVEEFYAYNPIHAVQSFEEMGLGHQDDIISIVWMR